MPLTIAVVTDLIFSTKITGTAKALGGKVLVARSEPALLTHLDTATEGEHPLVIIDLNASNIDPAALIRAAKSHKSAPQVVAFLSHVQAELAIAARDAGADTVMARSAFVDKLPALLTPTA